MNARQKLIYKLTKHMYRAIKINSKDNKSFKHHYRYTKWCYKYESDNYIKTVINWLKEFNIKRREFNENI